MTKSAAEWSMIRLDNIH